MLPEGDTQKLDPRPGASLSSEVLLWCQAGARCLHGTDADVCVCMCAERDRATELSYEDPVNPSYEATTTMYHDRSKGMSQTPSSLTSH
ncbi:hypothetical protein Pcinc_002997 [Petrolisthes cinctipes]|uniref:Uncharacterized protein n=1 Tax=Petrolisthes cinctipes TaxID=88211 RepID=A0AAE1GJS3_PETCI|nr:hypothetical protein Pcinc_002997 [Petrolisthes cinctipes]